MPSFAEMFGHQLKAERTAITGVDDPAYFASLVGVEPHCLETFESGSVMPNAILAREMNLVLYILRQVREAGYSPNDRTRVEALIDFVRRGGQLPEEVI